jgi:hypothetical protein
VTCPTRAGLNTDILSAFAFSNRPTGQQPGGGIPIDEGQRPQNVTNLQRLLDTSFTDCK